jgi:hypothetical protein
LSFPSRIKHGVNSSGNPGSVPAKAGIYKELGSCFHRKPWIPDQVRDDRSVKSFLRHYTKDSKMISQEGENKYGKAKND